MAEPAATATAQRTSGYAIAALVLGIVSLFIFGVICGTLAIIFGVKARNEIDRTPGLGGRQMATAGLVLGILGVVLWAVIILIWLG